MAKSIRMRRDELVWETRVSYFNESDWNSLKEYYSSFENYNGCDPEYGADRYKIYLAIKDLSYDDVIADFEGEDSMEVIREERHFSDGSPWYWSQTLNDIVVEWMREDNYEAEVCDTSYADDCDEYVDLVDFN